ncbi:MAG: ABC transporter permease [Rhodocyclaceae bacterium]|nr:MAG: ABC transporter permease [Rhodocyclaceae bacterium]
MLPVPLATLELLGPPGERSATLSGAWTLAGLRNAGESLERALADAMTEPDLAWNALGIDALDSAGAVRLWRAWGQALPLALLSRPEHGRIFDRLAAVPQDEAKAPPPQGPTEWIIALGRPLLVLRTVLADFLALLGQLALDLLHVCRHPADMPWKEISANLFKSGVRAMPVTALVGFLIGVVLSYLSALQLRQFGADVFIINILGMGIVRELGPVLTAVLVAGRSGSAMTAQLGVMRVTEEIDALATMGVSRSLRLIFPKVVALAIAMPLLVLWTSAMAIIGGMVSAWSQLNMSHNFFFQILPRVVPLENLWIAQGKGFTFGIAVALVACHFGLRVRPNTESLSANTTSSVVTAITAVILIDAVIAIATRGIGVPKL